MSCPFCAHCRGIKIEKTAIDRAYYEHQVQTLLPYILEAMKRKKRTVCEACGSKEQLQIHHKRYAPDITINDLSLLCVHCHDALTEASWITR